MVIKSWPKVGEPSVLAEGQGKSFVCQKFINPKTGSVEDFTIFHSPRDAVVILPITVNNRILITSQFRHAAGSVFMEFPGGNKDPGEAPLKTAKRELLEETGYSARTMIQARAMRIWADPGAYKSFIWPFLALDCKRIRDPQLDSTECIEVTPVSVRRWLEMIQEGLITDCKTLAITMLFLPYLKA